MFRSEIRCRASRTLALCVLLVIASRAPAVEVAGELFVDLDAGDPTAGTAEWTNNGTLGNFFSTGAPVYESVNGVDGVNFDVGDAYQAGELAPAGLTGLDPTRSIEVWTMNPDVAAEETLVAWGRRGGPDGTNMSFNYGTSGAFGAVGHWGDGPDLGWDPLGDGAPAAGVWHHLVYTYDGETTRVYADGVEANSEFQGLGVINTHVDTSITLASQLNNVGALDGGNQGVLYIGRVRVHDEVLTPEQIEANYLEELPEFTPVDSAPEIVGPPASDEVVRNATEYSATFSVTGFPAPNVIATSPLGATVVATGGSGYSVSYPLPDPLPDSFTVTVQAANVIDTAEASWLVTVVDAQEFAFETAGEVFVSLDASDRTAGSASWTNDGTLGNFTLLGAPFAQVVDGAPAVTFAAGDSYQCEDDAPLGVTGLDPTRSVEVWAHNPEVATEETLIAWSYRGGPAGTNMSFNYGTHGTWGAVGHWDAPDIAWFPGGDGAPRANTWHHLVYTYDGATTNVYVDGELTNTEFLGAGVINTYGGTKMTLATQIADAAGALDFGEREGTLSIGEARVHDGVLTPEQILSNFELGRAKFGIVDTAPEIDEAGLPQRATFVRGSLSYSFNVSVTGYPEPTLDATSTAGAATVTGARGTFTVQVSIPDPPPDSFDVTVTATNSGGRDQATFTVTAVDPQGEVVRAGETFVEIYADDEPAETWINHGTLADLVLAEGFPFVEVINDASAVTFNAAEAYQTVEPAPDGLVGVDPTRSVEAWVYNPTIDNEETIVSLARRGGPDGTNMSFNYGTNAAFGAVGHWGNPDIGWDPTGAIAPIAGQWHHLVYTYDGTTTRVYADGQLANSEVLGAGSINTHAGIPITVASQVDADGVTLTAGLRGSLSIGAMRIHDGVLEPGDVLTNYLAEKDQYPVVAVAPIVENFPVGGSIISGEPYSASVVISGFPPPTITVEPAGAVVSSLGGNQYQITFDPAPTTNFSVTLTATNDGGEDVVSWDVTVETLPPPGVIAVAGELFVDLVASDPSAGTETWENNGTLDDFVSDGNPVAREVLGVPAVDFDGASAYQCLEPAPDGLTGIDPTRSIEVWAFNPVVDNEETLVAWSQRGGPDGTNMSFNYGTNAGFGAVGHWGPGPDLGWRPLGAVAPAAGQWHHLAYTYDGGTTRVYEDGVQVNSEVLGAGVIDTYCCTPIAIASQIDAGGIDLTQGLRGTLAIAAVRVHDGVLSPAKVAHNYEAEQEKFTAQSCPANGLDPEFADTHCDGVDVTGPAVVADGGAGGPGTYTVTARGSDETGDEILHTFTATDALGNATVVGPQKENSANFELTIGTWLITATVDDNTDCADEASDATCSTQVVVEEEPRGVAFLRGDSTGDGVLNITDPVKTLGSLFLGDGPLACDAAADATADGVLNITDPVRVLGSLFLGDGPLPPPNVCGDDPLADPEFCARYVCQ